MFSVIEAMIAGIATSRSASAKTTFGDLPPSSSLTGTRCCAAARITARPVTVEPTKLMWSMSGCPVSATPASGPSPVTTLSTPGGSPARRPSSASANGDSGAISDGFSTTVLPAASAGATLAAVSTAGTFHGMITAQTPYGSGRV